MQEKNVQDVLILMMCKVPDQDTFQIPGQFQECWSAIPLWHISSYHCHCVCLKPIGQERDLKRIKAEERLRGFLLKCKALKC